MGGLTRSGRYYSPEELRKAKQARESHLPVKEPIAEKEAEEFLKKMKMQDYSIIDQLRKTPTQISLLSLLLHSEEHHRVLIKTLNEAYVSEKTTVNQLEKMAERFFEVNRVTFSDDDLHEEGAGHNRALHLMVKCEGHYIKRVMIDGGSSVDVCPFSTLQQLKLTLTEFRVVMSASELLMEGRGSIWPELYHPPYIKWSNSSMIAFEVIEVDQVEEGKPILHPHLSATSMMVAALMLRNDYEPGKGLGSSMQGIVNPSAPFSKKDTFGLGFKPTSADIDKAKDRKKNDLNLSKPIPHIAYSFVKPQIEEVQNPTTQDDIDEVCQGLKEMFYEINTVQVGEGPSRASIQLIGPDTSLNNWEATPLPIRKESCFINAGFKNMTCTRNSCPDLKKLSNLEIMNQEVEDVFAWSYDDMPGLSADLVVHKLSTYPNFPPIQQKQRNFKTDMSDKIKEEITKQLSANVIRIVRYTTWLANVVPVPKKDGKIRAQGDWETRDIKLIPYRQCVEVLSKSFKSIEFRYIPKFHNELADALATLPSMLPYPGNTHIDPLEIQIRYQHGYYNTIEAEPDGKPWYRDIKQFLKTREYPEHANRDQNRTIRRLSNGFFLSGEILYKRTLDLNLLRCVDAKEAEMIMNEPKVSNGHRFILVAIDYFTKWVEAIALKVVTKKAVVDFVHSNIICRFGIPKTIITDNAANLNSHLMKEVCEQFKIEHRNSTPYRPKANEVVEAANKNIKKILRKMIQGSRQWHEKLPFALLGYRTTVRTSVSTTPYLLVYGIEAIIPDKIEIPSLRIIVEAGIEDTEWVFLQSTDWMCKKRLHLSLEKVERLISIPSATSFDVMHAET
ncbi:uncharacterized protein [Nicotiana tomentosiformis]|uniref:uncharacterized protein n=1 Tax=Nicotiana tomentosiformis TaxID=4098 RepID=UPI00388C7230